MTPSLRAAIVAGGAIGTLLRWGLSGIGDMAGMPVGTLTANLLGALALGAVAGKLGEASTEARWTPLTAGLLGGATTFAGLVIEIVDRWSTNTRATALYLALSVIGGLAAVALGRRSTAGART